MDKTACRNHFTSFSVNSGRISTKPEETVKTNQDVSDSEARLGSGKERNFNSPGVKLFQLFKFNRLQVCSCFM